MSDFKKKLNDVLDTEDTSAFFSDTDIRKNKAMACLSYWGLLLLVPIFAAKDSPYARYHANQGLLLFLVNIAYGIVSSIINSIVGWIPVVRGIVSGILTLGSIAIFVYVIVRTVEASRGKAKDIPIIGKFRLIK